ncbi:MCP four helix bundle domain-containing protein [Marinoscillum sp. MHG1-6]|uniref:MCP four helix bundle domain-containing protein n=1 Tax=Marinoscillum sp. MHG1-6 TaxID=2959627 RepID=UPI0021584BC2|nr:MCP four helix bundle domain-containing protein [Marinoscillum sp. MHG1-6]
MGVLQRIKWFFALLVVFLLVLATNMMDKKHFEVVENALKTVYEDRLVVKDYIYKIASNFHHKQEALLKADAQNPYKPQESNQIAIEELMQKYSQTRLTEKEALLFNSLREEINHVFKLETTLQQTGRWTEESSKNELLSKYEDITDHLDQLFEIQLKEGKRQIDQSNKAIEKSNFMSKIEIGILIVIGLLIQVIIFYRSSSKS